MTDESESRDCDGREDWRKRESKRPKSGNISTDGGTGGFPCLFPAESDRCSSKIKYSRRGKDWSQHTDISRCGAALPIWGTSAVAVHTLNECVCNFWAKREIPACALAPVTLLLTRLCADRLILQFEWGNKGVVHPAKRPFSKQGSRIVLEC